MSSRFSGKNRTWMLERMAEEPLDVLVIGGGITGAGILLDAAARGMRAGLVEMQDFAAGTSSRSTKLVHGGLRYLKQLQIGVVAEVGRERAIVYENGPHVTTPERMLLPIYEGGTFGRRSTSLGLRVYDLLAGVKRAERRTMLTASAALEAEPLLKPQGLLGGGYYVEYRTDDARLTIEVMKAAISQRALAANYAQVTELLYEGDREAVAAAKGLVNGQDTRDELKDGMGGRAASADDEMNRHAEKAAVNNQAKGRIIGAVVKDLVSGREFELRARKVVNAAGPWVDTLRELDGSKQGKMLQLTKGVHLVFDQGRFPLRQAVYFDTPDGRMVFAIPREGITYVGTTDTVYRGDLVHPRMTAGDRQYLLDAVNGMFPALRLTAEDVESSWAGVRPLIHEEGKSPSEISRKDEIWESASGLITIAGGKLTGYRRMAETVVDRVAAGLWREHGLRFRACPTRKLPVSGGCVESGEAFEEFVRAKRSEAEARGVPGELASKWARMYGSNADRLIELAAGMVREEADVRRDDALQRTEAGIMGEKAEMPPEETALRQEEAGLLRKEPQANQVPEQAGTVASNGRSFSQEEARSVTGPDALPLEVKVPLQYALDEEMVVTPGDFFIRRTGWLLFDIARVREWKEAVVSYMERHFDWTPEQRGRYRNELERALKEAVVPKVAEEDGT